MEEELLAEAAGPRRFGELVEATSWPVLGRDPSSTPLYRPPQTIRGDSVTRSLHFNWELGSSGWATCRIWDGATKHRDIVSYCTNALADLLKGVTGLYGLHDIQRFSFDLEPAEARWVLRRRSDNVHITIRHFPDMSTSFDAPDGKGTLVWTSTRPRTSLAHAVLMAAEKVRRTHGEDGYLQKWVLHAFPTTELETLRHLHLAADDCALQH
ncbi:hypothetical protein OG473_38870 [Streptomyces anulatus]|uniref:hypothetical protein n=1 Tax=Streptomyces anulatus TaxID=1892 RepID=UPI0022542ED7|nr:hypothetical protein [Streptomyces anulatus]MCX4506710.1 hypothetical protein [Streptomyces anulatus]